MIKLIVSDIDGTLVNHKKEIPPRFWDVFKRLKTKNIRFCVASGRQMQSLEQLFAPIASEIGFISDNGALIKFQGRELFEKPMKITEIAPVLAVCEQIKNIGTVVCGKKKAYIKTDSECIFDEIVRHYPAHQRVDNFSAVDDTIFKISICDEKTAKLNSFNYLKEFSACFNVVISGELWLDVTDKEVNKGLALKELHRLWGITPLETAVFGDQLNDLEMMQAAQFSFAMKNAQPEVKQIASFVTDYDNDNEGVVFQIEKILGQMS
ncbi:HAD family hydrolase [Capnocytophaga sp.]|uniref:HAD family hydrolase n=1 Tax=Capnocytophaga sp. TaxID=44737 RepID=UPI0026DBBD58|nr:HAD family hydrolase [Capnocytophaga sp.]MDO5106524.1 HAD family hydrolase [Capnocytophaga sp.]